MNYQSLMGMVLPCSCCLVGYCSLNLVVSVVDVDKSQIEWILKVKTELSVCTDNNTKRT